MNKKTIGYQLSTLLLIATLFTMPVKAQVTIGDNSNPHNFSILELTATNQDGGLRMPQLKTEERDGIAKLWTAPGTDPDIVEAARGLVIYNITTNCMEFWNGATWISLCGDSKAVSGDLTIDACVGTMYDFQYQTITAYGANTAVTKWQWYAKRRDAADTEYKLISNATAASYKIPAYFAKSFFNDNNEDYNGGVVFKVEASNMMNAPGTNATGVFDIEFISTIPGEDGVVLNANYDKAGNPSNGIGLKIAYLNLGAERDANGTQNACNFGDMYQWGRQADGHEKIIWIKNSDTRAITFDAVTTANTADVSGAIYDSNYQVSNTDQARYGKFLLSGGNVWNTTTAGQNYQYFWATSTYDKTPADPCPSGWRVPTRFEIGAIFKGEPTIESEVNNPSTATENTWTWRPLAPGSRIAGGDIVSFGDGSDKSKRIFLPAAGVRSGTQGGNLSGVVAGGYYATSTYRGTTDTYLLIFNETNVIAGARSGFGKINGYSVRCVKE